MGSNPFQLKVNRSLLGPEWRLTVISSVHNHPAVKYLKRHSYSGRLSKSETSTVIEMSKCHVQPKVIMTPLKLKDSKNAEINAYGD